tara:strand:+ start:223 stop:369 length:147 start_codon:yes stop_codon:yes gene_type:complete
MGQCTSCKKETQHAVKLKCPNCGEEILRCHKCRGLSIEYECECGYQGP